MKKSLFLISALLFISTAFAQKPKAIVSFYGGVTLPKYSYADAGSGGSSADRKIYQGYCGGMNLMVYEFSREAPGLGLGFGANYFQAGAVNKSPAIVNATEAKNRINYLQGELLLGIKVQSILEVQGGLYISRAMSGQSKVTKTNGTVTTADFKFGTATTDDFNPDDLGLSFNAIINISKVKLGICLHQGLGDIAPQKDIKIRNEIYSITLGFGVGGKGKK
jgi:hypothetical protein